MIDDDLSFWIAPNVVGTLSALGFAATHAEMPQDHIVRVDVERSMGYADAIPWCRLSSDRNVRMLNINIAHKIDDPSDTKDDDALTFCFHSGAETSRACVVEIGYGDDLAAATTRSEHATTPSSREGRNVGFK